MYFRLNSPIIKPETIDQIFGTARNEEVVGDFAA